MRSSIALQLSVGILAVFAAGCSTSSSANHPEPSGRASTAPTIQPFPSVPAGQLIYEGKVTGTGNSVELKTGAVESGPASLQIECAGHGGDFSVKLMDNGVEYLAQTGGCVENGAPTVNEKYTAMSVPAGYQIIVQAPQGTEVGILIVHG